MPITINTKDLYKLLERTPSSHNIMLCGKHGVGKSEILTDFYSKKGLRVVTLFLGQMSDPGDLIGLPHIDEKSQKTSFLPPEWFPLDEKPVVLFLDELNRARPEILQAVMDLTLNRKLAGKSLPKGSYIISAVNSGNDYQITDLDPALVSRFNIYTFQPSVSEWIEWAEQKNLDVRILDFIKNNPKYLDDIQNNSEDNLEKTPDRRAWNRVSEIIKGEEQIDAVSKKIVAGIIGKQTTAKFLESLNFNFKLNGEDVLFHYDSIEKKLQVAFTTQFALINEGIFSFLQRKQYNPSDVSIIAQNLMKYTVLLNQGGKKEAFAHFVSFFTESKYPEANAFIMTNCNPVFQQILSFGRSI